MTHRSANVHDCKLLVTNNNDHCNIILGWRSSLVRAFPKILENFIFDKSSDKPFQIMLALKLRSIYCGHSFCSVNMLIAAIHCISGTKLQHKLIIYFRHEITINTLEQYLLHICSVSQFISIITLTVPHIT